MAPLLIDSRDLLKYGFVFVLLTILIFASGFFLGHQQAATFYQAGSEVKLLSLPEQTASVENITDVQVPSVVEAGEEIDVDQPGLSSLPVEQPDKLTADADIAVDLTPPEAARTTSQAVQQNGIITADSDNEPSAAPAKKIPVKNSAGLKDSSTETSTKNSSNLAKIAVSPEQVAAVPTFSSDQLSKIKYSIQVGMYVRLINAENMVKMLQAQHYDGYVTDYRNRENEIRYNVRFGYFADKKSAITRLSEFKVDGKGDGYLVNFSADNIVNLADNSAIEPAAIEPTGDVPAEKDETNKTPKMERMPSAVLQDKVSLLDTLNAMPATTLPTTSLPVTSLLVTTN